MGKPVQVLLSTYNGARFLEPLLDSVLRQEYRPTRLLARDDGSVDATVALLERFASDGRVRVVAEPNRGVVASFFRLLELADPTCGYFAFCDQDDVWQPAKLSRAVEFLSRAGNRPALYCSRVAIASEHLRPLGLSPIPRRGPSFRNALVQNIAIGCTVVVNREARALMLRGLTQRAVMHDWWGYIVVSAFGHVYYDAEPLVLYRQHGQNVIGSHTGLIASWSERVRRFRHAGNLLPVRRQAQEFDRLYGTVLNPENRGVLQRFLRSSSSLGRRLSYALRPDVYRQSWVDQTVMRVLIAVNRV